MDEFFGWILAIVLLMCVGFSLVNGLTAEKYYPTYQTQAEEICNNNTGVMYVEFDVVYHDVHCNNGAVFKDAIEVVGEDVHND